MIHDMVRVVAGVMFAVMYFTYGAPQGPKAKRIS
jgi:hypothetical protein